jgi:hypothetical protein
VAYGYATYAWWEVRDNGSIWYAYYLSYGGGSYAEVEMSPAGTAPTVEWFRIAFTMESPTAFSSNLRVRVFKGANIDGSTPDATAARDGSYFLTNPISYHLYASLATRTSYIDDVILDNAAWPTRAATAPKPKGWWITKP